MRTPSPQKRRLDLAPPLADRFIVEVAPSNTARYFSSCPSDPISRWTPCPPEYCRCASDHDEQEPAGYKRQTKGRVGFRGQSTTESEIQALARKLNLLRRSTILAVFFGRRGHQLSNPGGGGTLNFTYRIGPRPEQFAAELQLLLALLP